MGIELIQAELSRPASVLGIDSSLSGRRWVWRTAEDRIGVGIAQRLGLPEILGRLLAVRGVDIDAAADFLTPTLRVMLPDPSVLADMELAAERLAAAVRDGETVAVFGDYDVDGACSGALLAGTLRQLGCTVLSYVPDRLSEGYGPNAPALRSLAERGARLLVCVDCGTAAGDILAELHGHADIVVLDHHKSDLPPAGIVATVNPNRHDCTSGLGHLCAAAIVFLTLVATVRTLRRGGWFAARTEPDLLGMLDLVALATVCDVMPLTGLNRAFVTQGLRVMARRGRPGIAALLEVAQVKGVPSAMSLGFALGPRINAAGRIDDAGLGLRLLLCADPHEALALAQTLDGINRQRQSVEAGMLDAAMAAGAAQVAAGHAALVVAGEDWHPGVVGIVASRVRERFNRPALVAAVADGLARGSGRSVPGLDLGEAVLAARAAGLLTSGGGHAMAAGFALAAESLPAFQAFLDHRLQAAMALPKAADLAVEGTLAVPGCTHEVAEHLARLAPFGPGNEEPMLIVPRARVVKADRVGKDGGTVRAFVQGEGGGRLKAVMFRAGEGAAAEALLSRAGAALHLAGHLRAEEWNGTVSTGFVVTDVALA